jgi:Na+/melibiose symporter-like transporter
VPGSKDPEEAALDPIGAVLSIIGIVALVYALIEAPDKGWSSTVTLGAFALSAVVLAIFALWELRVQEPMLDIRYFRNASFSVGTGGMILIFLGMYGVLFLITQYFQLVLNLDPLAAALRTLPMSPIMLFVAPMTPRLTARFGASRTVGVGMVLVSIGLLMFAGISPHTPYIYIFACLTPFVVGLALSMSPMTSAIMSAVPSRRAGAGSAMNDAARELGAALGVAILGSIAASKYGDKLAHLVVALPPASRQSARSSLSAAIQVAGRLPGTAGPALRDGARLAFLDGMHLACIVGSILALVAAGVVLRYLPHRAIDQSPVDPTEAVDELGLDGVGIALAHD